MEAVEEIRPDLKWHCNTEILVEKGNKKLWMLWRLSKIGASREVLLDVFIKQIRSVFELSVLAWQISISQAEKEVIESVQKSACHIILRDKYES